VTAGQHPVGADEERCPTCQRRLRYKWPQVQRGESSPALRHGARGHLKVDPVAAELATALLQDRPELASYPEAVMGWARAEARCLMYADWHAQVGYLDQDGNPRGGGHVATAENTAARLRERLGLDPVADVQLQKAKAEAVHLVADLEGIRERGRAVLEHRRAELAAGEDMSEGVGDGA
jgi:hypothetical protein